jgi:hypothetical protein
LLTEERQRLLVGQVELHTPTLPPERKSQQNRERRATEHPDQCDPRQVAPRRHVGKPGMDGFELVLDNGEIGAGLIGLAQSELALVWHADMVPDDG